MAKLLAEGPSPTPVTPPQEPAPRQRQVRLRPEQIEALVADYEAGMGVAAVGRKYGVCVKTASAHLERAGIEIRQLHAIPDDKLAEALRLRGEGWTYQQLGDKYGCCRTTVSTQLRAAMDQSAE